MPVDPVVISRDQHTLSRANISPNALKVLYRLHKSGHQAFLVGGCVRDILLGLHPKDFDVATSATPEEVQDVFPRCRLIGRRFRLAHVRKSGALIEVATFRGASTADTDDRDHAHANGRILRDNVFGSLEEDAMRRDFTINALFYDPATDEILDWVGGLEDLDAGGTLDGEVAFKLHDTYGFPIDLTVELAAEYGVRVDREGFEAALQEQRERSRSGARQDLARQAEMTALYDGIKRRVGDTTFLGYETTSAPGRVRAIVRDGLSGKDAELASRTPPPRTLLRTLL